MRQNAATNWKYSKSYYQVNHQTESTKSALLHFQGQFLKNKATFPTPFQTIYYIAYFVHKYKVGERTPRKKEEQKSAEYLKLLKKLIDIQQLENTNEDKLADLRKDMKLDIEQMKIDIIAMK